MKFIQHFSGSKGNLYEIIANNGKRLIIDPGVPYSKIIEAFKFGEHTKHLKSPLANIEGCLLSHGHGDHSKAAKNIINAGIDIYASKGCIEECGIEGRRSKEVANKTLINPLDSFGVYCFDTEHDADEPLGFVVYEKGTGQHLFFATDTSFIRASFPYLQFSIIAIECSFDSKVLQQRRDNDDICEALATRLLTSHLELQQTKRYIREFCDLSLCTEIHLLHLSGSNIDAEKARKEIEREFRIETFIV